MSTSSAVPDDLRTYARRGAELAGRLDDVARRVHIAIEGFRSSRPDVGGDVPHMEVEIQAVAQGHGELDHWVGQVGEAFVKADSTGASHSGTSLVIADDQAIRRNINRGAGPRSRFSSRADATKAGTREAARVRGLLDGHHPKKLAAELGKAESSLADPDFAAGFFKGLGPKGTFDLLTAARGKGLLVVGRALALAHEHDKLPASFFEEIVDAAKRQTAALYAYEHGGGAIDVRDRQNYALHKYENGSTAPSGAYDFLDTIAPVTPLLEAGAKVAVIGGAVAIVSLGAVCVAASDGACAAPLSALAEQTFVAFSERGAPVVVDLEGPSSEFFGGLEAELSVVEGHLTTIDAMQFPENQAMLERIRAANASGRALTSAEENFLRHELIENELMKEGFSQEEAHALAGLTHPTFANYDPDVIRAYPDRFNDNWRAFWGIQ